MCQHFKVIMMKIVFNKFQFKLILLFPLEVMALNYNTKYNLYIVSSGMYYYKADQWKLFVRA